MCQLKHSYAAPGVPLGVGDQAAVDVLHMPQVERGEEVDPSLYIHDTDTHTDTDTHIHTHTYIYTHTHRWTLAAARNG